MISLVVKDSEAGRTRRNCGKPGLPHCKAMKTPFRYPGGDAVQERGDQVPFQDAINFLRELEEKW